MSVLEKTSYPTITPSFKHRPKPEAKETAMPPADPLLHRRIFVNRALPLDKIDAIGFDMDYTLAIYHQPQMEALTLRLVLQKLTQDRGYSPRILSLPYDPKVPMRGLIIDSRQGNLLKVDRYGVVCQGFHGSRPLHPEQIEQIYQKHRLLFTYPNYYWMDTLYALPEATLFMTLVDFLDYEQKEGAFPKEELPARYVRLFQDIRECTDESFQDGTISSLISSNIKTFIEADPDLPLVLQRFRSVGKKLFLLTNSSQTYAMTVMSYLLDGKVAEYPYWHHYFDFIVVDANKPAFFTEKTPFSTVDIPVSPAEAKKSHPSQQSFPILQKGNVHDLQTYLNVPAYRTMYVGDHIYGDMLRVKKSSVWRTALIVQELEQELRLQEDVKIQLQRLEKLERRRSRTDAELSYQQTLERASPLTPTARTKTRAKIDRLWATYQALNEEITALEIGIQKKFHPLWGPLFKARAENSLFGEQVKAYTCVYTSRVSNFLSYAPTHFFHPPREHLPHERVY